MLSDTELDEVNLLATGKHGASSERFSDGALSISYKIAVPGDPAAAYIVQLRSHGNVASMDSMMTMFSRTINPHILPVPNVYSIQG